MTPPDHRPYLREGDLRTPEDVLEWLLGHDEPCVAMACLQLTNRLDRERRRACRRGALEAWRDFQLFLRLAAECEEYEPDFFDDATYYWHEAARLLADALAFRAEARR